RLNRSHSDCVNHLLMELWVPFGWSKTVLRKKKCIVQVDRIVCTAARGIDIDDFDIFAHGARLNQIVTRGADLPWDLNCCAVERSCFEPVAQARVNGKDLQPALAWWPPSHLTRQCNASVDWRYFRDFGLFGFDGGARRWSRRAANGCWLAQFRLEKVPKGSRNFTFVENGF